MAGPWQAPFRKIKNEHENELYYGSQEWKHWQGAGQLPRSDCNSPASKGSSISKRTMPLCYGTVQSALQEGLPWARIASLVYRSIQFNREVVLSKWEAAVGNHKAIWIPSYRIYPFFFMHILIKHLLCAKFILVLKSFYFQCVGHLLLLDNKLSGLKQQRRLWFYALTGLIGWLFSPHVWARVISMGRLMGAGSAMTIPPWSWSFMLAVSWGFIGSSFLGCFSSLVCSLPLWLAWASSQHGTGFHEHKPQLTSIYQGLLASCLSKAPWPGHVTYPSLASMWKGTTQAMNTGK